MPFELVLIDSANKPRWFIDAYAPATTPALQGTPGGADNSGEWVGQSEDLLERAMGQCTHVAAVCAQRGPLSHTQASVLGEKLMSAIIGGRTLGSVHPEGQLLAQQCLTKAGVLSLSEEAEVHVHTDDELRAMLVAAAVAAVAEIERHVASSGGPFMAGDRPDSADALMGSVLYVVGRCRLNLSNPS